MKRRMFMFVVLLGLLFSNCQPRSNELLTIWVNYNDEEFALFSKLAGEYQIEHKTQFRIERIPFSGTQQKILTAVATNTAPDIARVDVAFVTQLAKKGAVARLDTFSGANEIKEQLVDAALKSAIIDGKLYGVPDQVTCLALFYNKKLFREAGLPSKAPETWKEFTDFAHKLTNKDKGIYGFAMRNTLWWTLPFLYTFGADFIEDGECALTEPKAIDAIRFKASLYKDYKVEAGAWRSGAVDPDMGFQSGKYAMVLNGPWKVKTLTNMGMEFGVGLIPKGSAGSATNVGGTDMVIFKRSEYSKEAFEFLRWLTSPSVQKRWANQLGQLPVNTQAFDSVDLEKHPYLRTFMEQLRYARPRPPLVNYADIENAVNPEMELVLAGKKSVEKAMIDACVKMDEVLGEER